MDATRMTALVAGSFYLITFATSIPAVFLLAPVLNQPDHVVSAGFVTSRLLEAPSSALAWSTCWRS